MVFDLNRLTSGIIITVSILFFYYFNLDYYLVLIISALILYDLLYSKLLLNYKNIFLFFFLFIFIYLKNNFISLYFIFLVSIILSLYIKKLSNFFFIIYLFLFIYFLLDILLIDKNILYIILIFSFINDTTAYIFGRLIKGPLITPKISPNKTYSGTIISFLISILFIYSFSQFSLIFTLLISISFFIGDIYCSFIKRINSIKDFSNLLKGHGGILDRVDSTILPIFFSSIFYHVQ